MTEKDESASKQPEYILTGSVKCSDLHIFNAESGKKIESLKGHKNGIWKVHAHDEERIFSGGRDKRIIEWGFDEDEDESMVVVAEYMGHTDWIRDIVSINSSTIASCSDDSYLKLWDVKTHWCKYTLRSPSDKSALTVLQVIDKKDTPSVVCGSQKGFIHLFDVTTQKPKISWKGHENSITGLIYSLQRRELLYSCEQYSDVIKIWDARLPIKNDPEPVGELFSHTNEIWDMLEVNDYIYTAAQDGSVKEWDLKFKNTRTWNNAHDGYCVYCLSRCGDNFILSGGDDNKVKKINIKTGKCEMEFESEYKIHDVISFPEV